MATRPRKRRNAEASTNAGGPHSRPAPRSRSTRVLGGRGRLLPTCDGPKIHPFEHDDAKIEYEGMLSEANGETTSGGEGHVFKVQIKSKKYALKLFNFFDLEEEREQFSQFENSQISDAEFEGHIDPFYAECRAYGRIEEETRKGSLRKNKRDQIVALCYGYIFLRPDDEGLLCKRFGIKDWNRPNGNMQPIRGLVKELIEQKDAVDKSKRTVRRMRNDLWALQKIRVYPRNIVARNYRAGLLLDLGQSFTTPHCALRVLPDWQAQAEIDSSLQNFDKMIEALGIKTTVRAAVQTRGMKTRSDTSCQRQEFWELDASGELKLTNPQRTT